MANPGHGLPALHRLLSRRDAVIVAIVATLITGTLAWLSHEAFPRDGFLFLYMPVIGAVAYVGGLWPGLIAAALSIVSARFFVLQPVYTLSIGVQTGPILAMFALVAVLLVDGATRLRIAEIASYRLALLVETADDAIFSKSLDGVIETWNRGAERLYGYTVEEAVGHPVTLLVPPDRSHEMVEIMAQLRRGKRLEHFETVRLTKDGRHLDVSVSFSPIKDVVDRVIGASVIARDISDQKQAARERAQLYEAERVQRFAAEKAVDQLGRLLGLTRALADALGPRDVAEAILAHGTPALDAQAGAVYVLGPAGDSIETLGQSGYPQGLIARRGVASLSDHFPVVDCINSGQAIYADAAERLLTRYPGLRGRMHPLSGARVYLPLITRGQTIGALAFVFRAVRSFDAADREFMQVLARQCAQALERARLYAREHQIANRLQHALLPTLFPEIPGLIIDAVYKPGAGEADIGGDWYDAFVLPGDRLVLGIGDVAGRGLEAAVLMGEIRHAIRAAALAGHDPAKVLQVANSVVRTGPNRIATAAVAMIDPMTLQCTYANAGHPPPVLATGEGIETLEESTFPLGVRDGLPVVTESFRLPSEALLTLYTDGLTEFDKDAVAGEAALQRAVQDQFAQLVMRPAQAIENQVLSGRSAHDDIAILTVFVKSGIAR